MLDQLKLKIKWSKKEQDFVVYYPRRADGGFIQWIILGKSNYRRSNYQDLTAEEKNYLSPVEASSQIPTYTWLQWDWIKELDLRGYDITTLKFEVTIKLSELNDRFAHLWDTLSEAEKEKLARVGVEPKSSNL